MVLFSFVGPVIRTAEDQKAGRNKASGHRRGTANTGAKRMEWAAPLSMAYRLDHSAGGKSSLQIIVNNCGNALYFRTTDIQTQENVEQRIPGPPVPNRPHVVKVRPLSSLGVGQCYALRCDGTWGLFKVQLAV
jgi:hypothetical protein